MPVDSYCKGCVYLIRIYYGKGCNFSSVTGHSRGCKSGTGCTQRQYGKKKRQVSSFGDSIIGASTTKKAPTPKPKKPPETEAEYLERRRLDKQRSAARTRARLQGRQHDAIQAFKDENGYSNRDLSEMLGVSESTVQKWCSEYQSAQWDRLESIGIKKPEGVD